MKKIVWVYIVVFCLGLFVRLYNLGKVPPSLYWDQVALGYDAYSILKTGKDLHGHAFPIVAFESFGDWKPAGYFYLVVPFIWLLGLQDRAVVLPSVIAGLLLIVGVVKLGKKIGLSTLSSLFVTSISPWAIQFSRSAWEANVATTCLVWASVFGLLAIKERVVQWKSLTCSVLLFIFSMYTYHSAKIIAPALFLGLVIFHCNSLWPTIGEWKKNFTRWLAKNYQALGIPVVVGVVCLIPLLSQVTSSENTHRFQETNIFSDVRIIEKSNAYKEAEHNSLLSRIFFHRYILFSNEVLNNYFSHFTLQFLFLSGDSNPRHSTQFVGEFYHIEAVFLLLGIYCWVRKKTGYIVFLFYWLFVAIIPASITTGTPHALRILPALPIFLLLIATGLEAAFYQSKQFLRSFLSRKNFKHANLLAVAIPLVVLSCLYLGEFLPYWSFYQNVYPTLYSREWQYGYKELMSSILKQKQDNPSTRIYITREQGRPAMYYWFYTATDPRLVQNEEATALKDQGEFLEFDTIKFITNQGQITTPTGILAASPQYLASLSDKYSFTELQEIRDLENKVIWSISSFQQK